MTMIDFACKDFRVEEILKCGLGLTRSEMRVFAHTLSSGEWLHTDAIAADLGIDQSTAQRAMKKLHEHGIVVRQQENREHGGYAFVYRALPREDIRKKLITILRSWLSRAEAEIARW